MPVWIGDKIFLTYLSGVFTFLTNDLNVIILMS
jgi:hypothetical protein